jgi:hypothetical protein
MCRLRSRIVIARLLKCERQLAGTEWQFFDGH